MNDQPPQHSADHARRRPRDGLAAWCAAAGVSLGIAAVLCSALGAISAQQTIALAMPGAILIVGGLIASISADAATAQRHGFDVGLRLGSVLSRWRSAFCRPSSRS
jgi:hypothetical protein